MITEFLIVNAIMAVAVLTMPLLAAWQARPTATPSQWSGLRTEKTRVSPEAWRAGHRAALPVLRVGGAFAFVFACAGMAAAVQGWNGLTMICAMAAGAGAMVVTGMAIMRANEAADAAASSDGETEAAD